MSYDVDDGEIGNKLSDIALLLEASIPEGYDDYYNIRTPLLGKEISIGFLTDKTDMMANLVTVYTIQEMIGEGQLDFGLDLMTLYQNDIKTTPSIEGKLLDRITGREIKYTTTQTLHEHTMSQQPVKKGILGRFRNPPQGGSQ